MGAYEVQTFITAAAPGAGPVATTPFAAGGAFGGADSATVRATGTKPRLLNAWAENDVAGNSRIRSFALHDPDSGIRWRSQPTFVGPIWPDSYRQNLTPLDVLTIEHGGSAVAGNTEVLGLLYYYDAIAGIPQTMFSYRSLRYLNLFAVTLAPAGTAGVYTTAAINSVVTTWKPGYWYALLGYLTDTRAAQVFFGGQSSTAGLRHGGPGEPTINNDTAEWFFYLEDAYGYPATIIFHSGDVANVFGGVAQDSGAGAPVLTALLAQLIAPKGPTALPQAGPSAGPPVPEAGAKAEDSISWKQMRHWARRVDRETPCEIGRSF